MSILSNKFRIGTVGITVAAMSLAALPATAAEARAPQHASKQENIGVFTGLAVGAAAAGPIGAMVGMVAGAWLGDRYHRQSVTNHNLAARNQDLTASLGRSERERHGLAGRLDLTAQSLASTQAQRAELDRTVQLSDDIETDVAFRTADASINDQQLAALRKLGALAASLPPGATVRIDGYADPRGPATLNDDLSLRRAETVALMLEQAGCPQDRLVIAAHGSADSTSPRGDLDAYAFDRRVTVRLQGAAVAQADGPGPAVADATPVTSGSP
ncbi:MAG TPA: OmpA family protein [Steroidobacteraceae bacterium]|jgi:outer membrane protein OmpA-like peptidoglycan-associated protein|nr:OmpA family protein [Steroidobacteraceae bacterium]